MSVKGLIYEVLSFSGLQLKEEYKYQLKFLRHKLDAPCISVKQCYFIS